MTRKEKKTEEKLSMSAKEWLKRDNERRKERWKRQTRCRRLRVAGLELILHRKDNTCHFLSFIYCTYSTLFCFFSTYSLQMKVCREQIRKHKPSAVGNSSSRRTASEREKASFTVRDIYALMSVCVKLDVKCADSVWTGKKPALKAQHWLRHSAKHNFINRCNQYHCFVFQ